VIERQIVKPSPASGKPTRRRLRVLVKRSDFLRTFRSGLKIRPCEWLIFNYVPSSEFRCGWTCPKAVGSAPIRNRMKRWTRDWIGNRLKSDEIPPPIDLNVGFRAQPAEFFKTLKRTEFDRAMEKGWNQLLKRGIKPVVASAL